MARKTFISYKYTDAWQTRNKIIKALGSDASYYTGETSDSPDLGDLKTATIKNKLSGMIFPTTVMIVVISPNVDKSDWIKWEIEYATKRQTRSGRQSQPNGIVMVIEDSLIAPNNTYKPNQTTRLIKKKSNPYIVSLNAFLRNPDYAIEKAYKRAYR